MTVSNTPPSQNAKPAAAVADAETCALLWVIGSGTIVEREWVEGALILQGANERELARLGHVQHPVV